MEENVENEYIVTDENGCATDPSIFGEWEYNSDTNTLMASFNAFKFPSSDNIRFQCNIRVCFGKCQPVNCRGGNAFGKRRRREITDESQQQNRSLVKRQTSNDDLGLEGTLREEITISSNAILTFEKRDGRYSNSDNRKFFYFKSLREDLFINNEFIYSSETCGSACRRHLRVDDWFNNSTDYNSIVGFGSRCSGCLLLAYGLQTTTKGSWSITTSTRVSKSALCQS